MTEPRTLDLTKPADAVEAIASIVGKLRMDGLTGGEVGVLFQSIETIRKAISPLGLPADK